MMNPVHPRRHDHEIQKSLQRDRQSPVGMVKECRRFERDEENNQKNRPNTEERHREEEEPRREKHFTEMKSRRGAHVQIEIGVMDVVKAPEERNHVVGPMPPPIGIIHEQKRADCRGPAGQRQPVQQPNMSILRPHRYRHRDRQHRQANKRKTGDRHHKIADKSMNDAEMAAPQWETPLQPKQREKHAGEQRLADIVEDGNCRHGWK